MRTRFSSPIQGRVEATGSRRQDRIGTSDGGLTGSHSHGESHRYRQNLGLGFGCVCLRRRVPTLESQATQPQGPDWEGPSFKRFGRPCPAHTSSCNLFECFGCLLGAWRSKKWPESRFLASVVRGGSAEQSSQRTKLAYYPSRPNTNRRAQPLGASRGCLPLLKCSRSCRGFSPPRYTTSWRTTKNWPDWPTLRM